jgi:membrane associated rhomboid family serine protease
MPRPVLTAALVAANVGVYALAPVPVAETYGLVPSHSTLLSMFTSMFLHVDLTHLVCNMVFLAVAGTIVEPVIGHLRFAALYVTAGVVGAMVHILVNPASSDTLIGASGAICGLLAVVTILRPRALPFVAALVALNIWWVWTETGSSVSFGCHLGGFVVGAMFALIAQTRGERALRVF